MQHAAHSLQSKHLSYILFLGYALAYALSPYDLDNKGHEMTVVFSEFFFFKVPWLGSQDRINCISASVVRGISEIYLH